MKGSIDVGTIRNLAYAVKEAEAIIATMGSINIALDKFPNDPDKQDIQKVRDLTHDLQTHTWIAGEYQKRIQTTLGV